MELKKQNSSRKSILNNKKIDSQKKLKLVQLEENIQPEDYDNIEYPLPLYEDICPPIYMNSVYLPLFKIKLTNSKTVDTMEEEKLESMLKTAIEKNKERLKQNEFKAINQGEGSLNQIDENKKAIKILNEDFQEMIISIDVFYNEMLKITENPNTHDKAKSYKIQNFLKDYIPKIKEKFKNYVENNNSKFFENLRKELASVLVFQYEMTIQYFIDKFALQLVDYEIDK